MATKLKMVAKWKGDLSNQKIKIGEFVQKSSWNERIACSKIWEKMFKKLFEKI